MFLLIVSEFGCVLLESDRNALDCRFHTSTAEAKRNFCPLGNLLKGKAIMPVFIVIVAQEKLLEKVTFGKDTFDLCYSQDMIHGTHQASGQFLTFLLDMT